MILGWSGISFSLLFEHDPFGKPVSTPDRHTFARFANDGFGAGKRGGVSAMNEIQSLFTDIDRICRQFTLALHNSEPSVYAALALAVLVGALLFPPRSDPDQV